MFLRYRAGKVAKAKADMVSKWLNAQTMARRLEEKANGHTAAQKARALAEDREECTYLVNQVLVEDSHFNFPKIHLLMHWSDQISQYHQERILFAFHASDAIGAEKANCWS